MLCKECRFFEIRGEWELGKCHFYPPIVFVAEANTSEAYTKTAWPRVRPYDGCSKGEFPRQAVEAPHEEAPIPAVK